MAEPVFAGGTGHRDLPVTAVPWIRQKTWGAAAWLAGDRGVTDAVCGMADGWDLIWGDAIARAGIRLWAAVPYPEQPDRFRRRADRIEWQRLLELAEDRVWVGGSLGGLAGRDRGRRANQLLWQRNLHIVDRSTFLVCCWNPARVEHCGTFNAISAARARGMRDVDGLNIDPAAQVVRMRLPAPGRDFLRTYPRK